MENGNKHKADGNGYRIAAWAVILLYLLPTPFIYARMRHEHRAGAAIVRTAFYPIMNIQQRAEPVTVTVESVPEIEEDAAEKCGTIGDMWSFSDDTGMIIVTGQTEMMICEHGATACEIKACVTAIDEMDIAYEETKRRTR